MSNKHFGISTKGSCIALVLFAAAIAVTGWLYYQNANRVREVSVRNELLEEAASTRPTKAAAPSGTKTTVPTLPAETTAPTEAPKRILKTAAPVAGEAMNDYAMECLSYNQTTRDWRTHNGIDLAAEEGTAVGAAADGTVYSTYEDDTLGYTVVVRHEGGYTTRYSNLREDLTVQAGDRVTLGQTLGYVGCSALVESAMDGHVHFSVSYQDSPIAPEDFLALG